jgi:hypothetical protein
MNKKEIKPIIKDFCSYAGFLYDDDLLNNKIENYLQTIEEPEEK